MKGYFVQCILFHVLDSSVEFSTKTAIVSVSHLVNALLSYCPMEKNKRLHIL